MYFFSHLFISRMLYARFKDKVSLSRWSFAFGNIKPDLPPDCFGKRHTLEDTLFIVCDRTAQLTENKLSKKEFSIKSGEVCHFICDYFCRYHLNDSMHKKILPHLLYEIRLHIFLYTLSIFRKIKLFPHTCLPAKSIASIIFEMRQEYLLGRAAIKKDIAYALTASVCTFDFILQHAAHPRDPFSGEGDAPVFPTKGGSCKSSFVC